MACLFKSLLCLLTLSVFRSTHDFNLFSCLPNDLLNTHAYAWNSVPKQTPKEAVPCAMMSARLHIHDLGAILLAQVVNLSSGKGDACPCSAQNLVTDLNRPMSQTDEARSEWRTGVPLTTRLFQEHHMQRQLLPLNALRAFAAVHETGGIRSAARTLDVTHSSVSRHLRFLEDSLGVALLDRDQNSRKLRFTPEGERLGQASGEALSLLSNAIIGIREPRHRNSIVISTAPSFASCWLMERIRKFNEKHPWIEISVLVDQQLTRLSDQGADIGIRIGDGAWAESEYRLLMDETLFPVCSPRYAERLGNTRDPAFLRKAKLLHDRDPQASWDL